MDDEKTAAAIRLLRSVKTRWDGDAVENGAVFTFYRSGENFRGAEVAARAEGFTVVPWSGLNGRGEATRIENLEYDEARREWGDGTTKAERMILIAIKNGIAEAAKLDEP